MFKRQCQLLVEPVIRALLQIKSFFGLNGEGKISDGNNIHFVFFTVIATAKYTNAKIIKM